MNKYIYLPVVMLMEGLAWTHPVQAISVTTTYNYDDINRLTAVTYSSGQTLAYSYDLAGNITRSSGSGFSTSTSVPVPEPTSTPDPTPTCTAPQVLQNNQCITPLEHNEPVTLSSGVTVDYQIFANKVQGDAQAPALLTNSTVKGSAMLSHVTIGSGTKVDPKATLQEGVHFQDNSLIPGGINLTNALSKIPGVDIPTINLSQDVVKSGKSILAQIQTKPLNNFSVTQSAAGLLVVQVGELRYEIRPVSLVQASSEIPAGVSFNDNGTVIITTAEGRQIILTGSVSDVLGLQQSLAVMGLNHTDTNGSNGNLTVGSKAKSLQLHHYAARPSLFSEPAKVANTPGLYLLPNVDLSNTFIVYHVFEQDGHLRQQAMLPVPEDWASLKTALQNFAYRGVVLNPDGMIQVDKDNQRFRGLMNYPVYTGDTLGSLRFEDAGDLNNDGLNDLRVIYPDGQIQELLLFPVIPSP